MAKDAQVTLACRIKDIKQVPNSSTQIVSVEFRLGQRTWHKPFRVAFDHPVSMEEFKRELASRPLDEIYPPEEFDFLAFVKQEADQPFEIKVNKQKPGKV